MTLVNDAPERRPGLFEIRLRRSSQRRPALPFDTIAANGWLSSCAIVAAIAPTVVRRATLSSSD